MKARVDNGVLVVTVEDDANGIGAENTCSYSRKDSADIPVPLYLCRRLSSTRFTELLSGSGDQT